jgi:hypothetical protein
MTQGQHSDSSNTIISKVSASFEEKKIGTAVFKQPIP